VSADGSAFAAPLPALAPRTGRRSARLTGYALLLPGLILVGLLLYWPLAFVVQMSFTAADSFLAPTGAIYTFDNYLAMAARYLPNVLTTMYLAALAAVVDLIFGFPFAYILVRRVRYRNVVRALMVFPMFGALYVAFGMRFLLLPGGALSPVLAFFGIPNTAVLYSLPSVVFAMAIFSFPFMVMNISTSLANVDPKLEEAAACLGARPYQSFFRVVVPLTKGGIVAGCLMVFGWSIGTFAEPLLLGSIAEQRSLAWTLYQRGVVQTDYGLATAMGVVLLVLAFVVTYLSLRFSRGALVD
jgi:ABC-type spermidine/putrescine transport system permease subunit I